MEDRALVLLRMVQQANATGAPPDRLRAREQCRELLDLLSDVPTINAVLPVEILTHILTLVVDPSFTYLDAHRHKWMCMRSVCRLWRNIADAMEGINVRAHFRYEDVQLRDLIRPFKHRFDAFPTIRALTVPLIELPGHIGFDMLMRYLRQKRNLRELTFHHKRTKADCLFDQALPPSIWKPYKTFLETTRVETLRLEGRYFRRIGPHLARFIAVGGGKHLTRLSIPCLSEHMRHLEFCNAPIDKLLGHAFCGRAVIGATAGRPPLDLSSMEALETLEVGSIDLRCNECALFLPRNLKTLVIHRPDQTNLLVPESLHLHVRYDRLVLKHVGEGAFYDDGNHRVVPYTGVSIEVLTEAERRFARGLWRGRAEYSRMLKRRINPPSPGDCMYDPVRQENIDLYEQYLLGLPSVERVSVEKDHGCPHEPTRSLKKGSIVRLGFRCWTVTLDLVEVDRPAKRKSARVGGGETKKRKSAR